MGCGELCCMHVRSGEGWHPVGGARERQLALAGQCMSLQREVRTSCGRGMNSGQQPTLDANRHIDNPKCCLRSQVGGCGTSGDQRAEDLLTVNDPAGGHVRSHRACPRRFAHALPAQPEGRPRHDASACGGLCRRRRRNQGSARGRSRHGCTRRAWEHCALGRRSIGACGGCGTVARRWGE